MANEQIIQALAASIANCNTDQELGPAVVVDLSDPTTIPSEPVAPHKKHCLIDAEGNLVGIVDADGPNLIIDEVGPAVTVDPTDPATLPADSGEWEKQCLVDAAGNMAGFVDADGSHLITAPPSSSDTLVDNQDYTAKATINGTTCDLSTLRLDDADDCYHYLVDTKTNVIVSSWCVDPAPQSFNADYNFGDGQQIFNPNTADNVDNVVASLFDDIAATGAADPTAGGSIISREGFNTIVPTTGWMSMGPYELEITNPSQCSDAVGVLTSRMGAYNMGGAAGAAYISILGTNGLNSPSFYLDIGQAGYPMTDPNTPRPNQDSISTPSSSSHQRVPAGGTDVFRVTWRIRRLEDFLPHNNSPAGSLAGDRALGIDGHKFGVTYTLQKPHGNL